MLQLAGDSLERRRDEQYPNLSIYALKRDVYREKPDFQQEISEIFNRKYRIHPSGTSGIDGLIVEIAGGQVSRTDPDVALN